MLFKCRVRSPVHVSAQPQSELAALVLCCLPAERHGEGRPLQDTRGTGSQNQPDQNRITQPDPLHPTTERTNVAAETELLLVHQDGEHPLRTFAALPPSACATCYSPLRVAFHLGSRAASFGSSENVTKLRPNLRPELCGPPSSWQPQTERRGSRARWRLFTMATQIQTPPPQFTDQNNKIHKLNYISESGEYKQTHNV